MLQHSRVVVEKAYKNISYLFLLILVFVGLGFFKTYFGLFPRFTGVPTMAHFHASGFLLWFALLIVQPLLIRNEKFAMHRFLGKFSYFLVPYILLTSVGMMRESYHRVGTPWLLATQPPGLFFALLGFFDFTLFYILAIVYRRRIDYHARYIVVTSLALIQPSLGRFFGIWLRIGATGALLTILTIYAILIGLMVYDKVKFGRIHKAYWLALAVTLCIDVSVPMIPTTHLWQAIALHIGRYL